MIDDIFPKNSNRSSANNSIAIQLYGNKIYTDQSLYEYLIEFLLVFVSPKNEDMQTDEMGFHTNLENELEYYVKPRIGLKRFIFYERSKKDVRIPADEKAYEDIVKMLHEKIGDRYTEVKKVSEAVNSLQDLFYGYAAVLRKRSWSARTLLPIAPELIFCEAASNLKERIKIDITSQKIDDYGYSLSSTATETNFEYGKYGYMARGGEVYYLHLLQALEQCTDKEKNTLQKLLKHLLTANSNNFSSIANWIEDTWVKEQNINPTKLWHKKTLGFIPATGYINCGKKSIFELTTFLSNEMHPVTRIELLSKGIVFQIMRMMCVRTNEYLEVKNLPWIIDLRCKKSGNTVMKISADSYRRVEEMFVNAINKKSNEHLQAMGKNEKNITPIEHLSKARTHTLNMFKRMGKEMQCIIPLKGGYERFSLSEDLVKFLVLSLIKPQGKMTFAMFLDMLYQHFNIVIGPKQYKECSDNNQLDVDQAGAFINNELEFQIFLKNTGFLRDLSDATAIVVNPYSEVEI